MRTIEDMHGDKSDQSARSQRCMGLTFRNPIIAEPRI
jgi:hypothetical protein